MFCGVEIGDDVCAGGTKEVMGAGGGETGAGGINGFGAGEDTDNGVDTDAGRGGGDVTATEIGAMGAGVVAGTGTVGAETGTDEEGADATEEVTEIGMDVETVALVELTGFGRVTGNGSSGSALPV